MTNQLVFDAGAFIALERNDRIVRAYVRLAAAGLTTIHTSSAVVAQVWRASPRQARMARALGSEAIEEVALDRDDSREIGALAAITGGTDVVDGHVALLTGRYRATAVTSDPDDLARWGVDESAIERC